MYTISHIIRRIPYKLSHKSEIMPLSVYKLDH